MIQTYVKKKPSRYKGELTRSLLLTCCLKHETLHVQPKLSYSRLLSDLHSALVYVHPTCTVDVGFV